MIEFAIDGKKIASFEKFLWRYGDMFLMWLTSIEYNSAKGGIYPVYTQAFDWSVHGGQATLTIYKKDRHGDLLAHVFVFQKRAPFVGYSCHVSKTEVPSEN